MRSISLFSSWYHIFTTNKLTCVNGSDCLCCYTSFDMWLKGSVNNHLGHILLKLIAFIDALHVLFFPLTHHPQVLLSWAFSFHNTSVLLSSSHPINLCLKSATFYFTIFTHKAPAGRLKPNPSGLITISFIVTPRWLVSLIQFFPPLILFSKKVLCTRTYEPCTWVSFVTNPLP